jgi:hypothetical protein
VILPSGISSGDALILPERHPACRRRQARPGFRMERIDALHEVVAAGGPPTYETSTRKRIDFGAR